MPDIAHDQGNDVAPTGWGPHLYRRYPTVADLKIAARRRLPAFAFEYGSGGAGPSDAGILRNADRLDAITLVPRYGRERGPVDTSVDLFGQRYAAPFGVAPMGGPSIVLPGADAMLASAAEGARVPFVLGSVGGISVEHAGKLAPSVLWLQLYPMPRDDHAWGFDMLDRAKRAGARVLVLTMDCPVRTVRPREVRQGISMPFRITPGMLAGIAMSPRWLAGLLVNGVPQFASMAKYAGPAPGIAAVADFVRREVRGAFSWAEVARYRERWKGPLVVKGILHPADARRALSLGVDGVWVSNHGGRQVDALPAAIDMLPSIVRAVGDQMTVMMDSGVRSGVDVARAVSRGAIVAFSGKAFLWGVGALGARGAEHVIRLYSQELSSVMSQVGAASLEELTRLCNDAKINRTISFDEQS